MFRPVRLGSWSLMCACAVLISLAASRPVLAHPHEFVSMWGELIFSDKRTVSGMRYRWRFDEFFSAYALEPVDEDGDGVVGQEGLDKTLAEILGNIHGIDYFIKFDTNGQVPTLGKAKPIAARMVGRQYEVEFEVPFKEPMTIGKDEASLSYAIYDDEFYIAMNHDVDAAIPVSGVPTARCDVEVVPPDPSEELQQFASSLSKTESGGPDLGIHFAEWVSLSCPR